VEDAKVSAVKTSEAKRIRGSKAALEDEVIRGSLIFGISSKPRHEGDEDDKDDDSDYVLSECDDEEDADENGRYNLYADELNIDIEDDDIDDDDSENRNILSQNEMNSSEPSQNAKTLRIKTTVDKFSGKRIAKTMYKLKNFKSYKLAQRHGEALGAHARGLNILAVDKLKDVAAAAPVAPQIYSSLGLVYESMLREETEKSKRQGFNKNTVSAKSRIRELDSVNDNLENICERIKLAKKTFGSYHVAALLCKMDVSLWVSDTFNNPLSLDLLKF
jgi:hypothetical protein